MKESKKFSVLDAGAPPPVSPPPRACERRGRPAGRSAPPGGPPPGRSLGPFEPGGELGAPDSLGPPARRAANAPSGALLTSAGAGDDLPLPDPEAERERRLPELGLAREEGARTLSGIAAGELAEEEGEEEEESEDAQDDGAEEKGGEEDAAPKVEIEIHDADGTLVRRFEEEVHRGVNRLTWNLTHDAPAEPDPGDLPRWWEPSGPDAVPGEYRVTLRFRGEEASAPLTVLPDPRLGISADDRRAKLAAMDELGALQEVLTDAIDRLATTRSDVGTLLARRKAARDNDDESDAAGDGEEDPLARRGGELLRAVDEEIRALWQPPGEQGIPAPTTPWAKVDEAKWIVGSDWHAPTEAPLGYLEIAEAAVADAVERVNRFYAAEVAPFRQAVRDDGLTLLPEVEPLALP